VFTDGIKASQYISPVHSVHLADINIALKKLATVRMTFKDTEGHYNCCYRPYTSITSCYWLLLQHLYAALTFRRCDGG